MEFKPENLYHIYNRGNNKERIFFEERNYVFFRDKIRKHICRITDLLAYCLMPNHFHLLFFTKSSFETNELNKEIAVMLRSYTRATNLQESRIGSLFQQKTKAKNVGTYGSICFNYIHQNPGNSGLVAKLEDWEYSSFREYLSVSKCSICNIELAVKLLNLPIGKEFYEMSIRTIKTDLLNEIF